MVNYLTDGTVNFSGTVNYLMYDTVIFWGMVNCLMQAIHGFPKGKTCTFYKCPKIDVTIPFPFWSLSPID